MTEIEKELVRLQDLILDLGRQLDAVLKDKVWERPWNGNEAAHFFGVSSSTIKEYRKYWHEGIHYFRLPGSKGEYRYNPELLKDWLENRNNENVHLRAIEVWNRNRLCNKGMRRRNK